MSYSETSKRFPMNIALVILLLLSLSCVTREAGDLEVGRQIKLNQIGFYPGEKKVAVVPATPAHQFRIVDVSSGEAVYTGELGPSKTWPFSGEAVHLADFSDFESPGRYTLAVDGVRDSHPFDIAESIHGELAAAALKAFYFHRCSSELEAEFAGEWARPAGHPDDEVLVHESAASPGRPAGSVISSPGGWYDAGDYGKYIVNSAITVYSLLSAYQSYPEFFSSLEVTIPESDNAIPDILDEALWNLRWMSTMQDPEDGGVYHKLTTKLWAGVVMPAKATEPRYVVQKTTTATLDFAATMAVAGRVFAGFSDELPGAAAEFVQAAESAWRWAQSNPDLRYEQPDGFVTGTYFYEHEDMADELAWAAVELFLATGDEAYLQQVELRSVPSGVPSWDYVSPLAWLSLSAGELLPAGVSEQDVHRRILSVAEKLKNEQQSSAYGVAMGTYPQRFMEGASEKDFSWGSNGVAGYQGMMLLRAYELTGDEDYLEAALANLDYTLGRNATGYCFVTGFGSRSPHNTHDRLSQADDVPEPVPGWVAGGPHDGHQDAEACEGRYTSNLPALSYLDDECSYATNEVAINWNAPLVYVAGAIEHLATRGVDSEH